MPQTTYLPEEGKAVTGVLGPTGAWRTFTLSGAVNPTIAEGAQVDDTLYVDSTAPVYKRDGGSKLYYALWHHETTGPVWTRTGHVLGLRRDTLFTNATTIFAGLAQAPVDNADLQPTGPTWIAYGRNTGTLQIAIFYHQFGAVITF